MAVIVESNTIVLTGTVGVLYWDEPGFTAAEVALALAEIGHDTDVLIRLNSDGGYASEAAAIHAALARHAGKVTIVIEGIAASAASLLAMAGDEIVMAPGSILMIHNPATMTWGTSADHETSLRYLKALEKSYAGIYAARSGRSVEQALADMHAEVWFAPEDAVAAGYANRVGNDDAAGTGAEIIEFPEREPDPLAFTMLRHEPGAFRNVPEQIKALAVANGWGKPQPSKAAPAAAPKPSGATMTTKPVGGGKTARDPARAENDPVGDDQQSGAPTAAEARAEALAYAVGVIELCELAGAPDKANGFIQAETSLDDVRKELVDGEATASAGHGNEIRPHHNRATAKRYSLADNMRGRFGMKKEA